MPPRRSSRASSTKPVSKAASKAVEKAATEKKPASKKATTEATKPKPASRKRAASPEREDDPPAKRARASTKTKDEAEAVEKPARKPASKAKPTSKATATKPASKKSAARPASKMAALKKAASAASSTTLAPIDENGGPEPATSQATEKPAKKTAPRPKAVPAPHVQKKEYFNPLPTAPEKQRPAPIIFAWGAGNFGQFGMGPDILDEIRKPKRSTWVEEAIEDGKFGPDGAGIETVCAGGLHSIIIDEQGTVYTCGVNDDAALGRKTNNIPDPNNPGQFLDVDELTSKFYPVEKLQAEAFRAVQATAGDSISAVVSADGDLSVWGSFRANEGALGFSEDEKNQYEPVSPPLPLIRKSGDHEKVVSVASGSNHILALTTHGNIFAWGASEQGQLGRRVMERRKINGTTPEKVHFKRGQKIVAIGAGSYHSFAVDSDGDVFGWGLNTMGQTGTGYEGEKDDVVPTPKPVKGLSREELNGDYVVEIAGGTHHTLFRTAAGKVYGVGRCNAGQLGLAEDDPAYKDRFDPDFITEPALITMPDDDDPVVQISCGTHNSAAVTEAGALCSWGQGLQGELGVAEDEVRTPRVIVRSEGGSWHAVQVSCGGQHTLGLFRKKN